MVEQTEIQNAYEKFKSEHPEFHAMSVFTRDGSIVMTVGDSWVNNEEAKALMDAWLNHKPAVEIGGARFPILKWDELQFAARNVKGQGAIVGCITKSGNFCVARFMGSGNLIQATVDLNRWSWNLV